MLKDNVSAIEAPGLSEINTRMMVIQVRMHIPCDPTVEAQQDPVRMYVYRSASYDVSILRGNLPSKLFVTTHPMLLDLADELEDWFGMLPVHPDDPRFYVGLDS